jgi:hypothetical protein
VANVAELRRLSFIPREFGFPLTLLLTHPVARDPGRPADAFAWRQKHGAEIGVHLHPWNTPPFVDLPGPEPIPTAGLPLSLVADKLGTLVNCISENFPEPPRSFRMGRFDWSPGLLELLPRFGLTVDTSMVPLTIKGPGLQNFLAPPDPFWLEGPASPGGRVLEAPVTMVPVWAASAKAVVRLAGLLPGNLGAALLSRYRFVGAAGIHPAWFPLLSMRLAAALHRRRGGRVLNLFLHSTELSPAAAPIFPTRPQWTAWWPNCGTFWPGWSKKGRSSGVTLSGLRRLLEDHPLHHPPGPVL